MRRGPRAPSPFGSKRPSPDDDGSGGRWRSGLPAEHAATDLGSYPEIEYHSQAGAPRSRSGGTYQANVDRSGRPLKVEPARAPTPFKLTK